MGLDRVWDLRVSSVEIPLKIKSPSKSRSGLEMGESGHLSTNGLVVRGKLPAGPIRSG
jgi:hypothetical protein